MMASEWKPGRCRDSGGVRVKSSAHLQERKAPPALQPSKRALYFMSTSPWLHMWAANKLDGFIGVENTRKRSERRVSARHAGTDCLTPHHHLLPLSALLFPTLCIQLQFKIGESFSFLNPGKQFEIFLLRGDTVFVGGNVGRIAHPPWPDAIEVLRWSPPARECIIYPSSTTGTQCGSKRVCEVVWWG